MDKAFESEPTVINVLRKMKSDGATQKEFIKYLQDITEKEKRGIRMSRRMARSVLIEWGFIVPRSCNKHQRFDNQTDQGPGAGKHPTGTAPRISGLS